MLLLKFYLKSNFLHEIYFKVMKCFNFKNKNLNLQNRGKFFLPLSFLSTVKKREAKFKGKWEKEDLDEYLLLLQNNRKCLKS